MAAKFPHLEKVLTPAVQNLSLKRTYPQSRSHFEKNSLIWECELAPSSLARTYTVRIRYTLDKRPDITVVNPKLEKREGQEIPHTYSQDRLCVYDPKQKDWKNTMHLAETIVPWTIEWLYFYEIWLATGEWCGGGRHPTTKKKRTQKKPKSVKKTTDEPSAIPSKCCKPEESTPLVD